MREDLLKQLCDTYETWVLFVSFNTVLFVLLIFSFLFIRQGTVAFVVAMLTLVVVTANFAIFGIIWIVCTRFRKTRERSIDEL